MCVCDCCVKKKQPDGKQKRKKKNPKIDPFDPSFGTNFMYNPFSCAYVYYFVCLKSPKMFTYRALHFIEFIIVFEKKNSQCSLYLYKERSLTSDFVYSA